MRGVALCIRDDQRLVVSAGQFEWIMPWFIHPSTGAGPGQMLTFMRASTHTWCYSAGEVGGGGVGRGWGLETKPSKSRPFVVLFNISTYCTKIWIRWQTCIDILNWSNKAADEDFDEDDFWWFLMMMYWKILRKCAFLFHICVCPTYLFLLLLFLFLLLLLFPFLAWLKMLCVSSSLSGRACNCRCFSNSFPGCDLKMPCFSSSLSRARLKMPWFSSCPFPGVIENAVFSNSFSSACAKCCVFPVPFLFPSSLPVPFPGIWECQYFGDNIGVFRCRYHNFSLVQPAPPCMCGTSAVCFLLDIFDN